MRLLASLLVWLRRATLVTRGSLVLENLALRQQLATYTRRQKRPRLKPEERVFWVALSRAWQSWRSPLVLVKPATVIDWHRRGFQRYWRWKSGKPGRPRIPAEHIAFIRRISAEQPGWGEDRIADELAIKLGVKHSTSTIRRYMVSRRRPRGGQTWRTFVRNHASQIFACDFLTQYTAFFTIVYIFVVMEIATRRIVLINVTTSPGLSWVQQQIRQATAWAQSPRFLIHDNDGIFGQFRDRKRRGNKGHRYLPSGPVAGGRHGHRGHPDPLRCAECKPARRKAEPDAPRGGVEPLHLPAREGRPARVSRLCGIP
jgi:putative transposase